MKITFSIIFLLIIKTTLLFNLTNCAVGPPRIEQHPMSIIVNVSDPVTLECRSSGEPKPKITWFRDGNQLNIINSKYTLIHDSNLFIISAALGKGNKSDTGVYHCKAQNEYGEAVSSNATLVITYLKDDFREMPKSRQVNAGTLVTMECKAPRGFPEPSIWWEKNNVQLANPKSESTTYNIFSNGSFVIANATIKDNGEYVCVAKNEAGIKRSQPAYLNVFEKPSFITQPETSKYQANTKVELECQANGFPKPLIEWKKDNSIDNIPLKAQIRDNILIIPNIQLEDEGEYTCMASNQLATIEAKSYLVVYEKPTFTKTMPNLTIGIESKSITIECNARGKPQPVIYWAKSTQMPSVLSDKNSRQNSNSNAAQDDFIILENGNLFIERLSKKYEGTYLCQASNEYGSIETKTFLQVKSIQSKPPPIIIYGPQNQTIPINTQATLECLTTIASNPLVSSNAKNLHQQQQYELNEKITVTWFKGNKQINDVPHFETTKYRVLDTGSLEVNAVQKSDSGLYRCVATNIYGQTSSIGAFLNVENPNNQYVEFQRNYETTALPSAPTQPIVLLTTTTSVSLSWQSSSHSGHSPLKSYTIEYFSPEWSKSLPGWVVLAENVPAVNSFIVENLQPDTYYMFMIRARNDQGYGPPSQASDLVKTLFEPQAMFRNKNSNEILEKALTGEVIQLNEPAEVLSSTSINVTWKILKSGNLIEGFYLKYKPIGSKEYLSVTITEIKRNYYVLQNLNKFTPYEILIEPFSGSISGSESNIIQTKTFEDIPSQSPINLNVELDSLTSVSIKWQPPPLNHMNGVINGYKISCIANETKHNLNINTNATTRAIILGNLVQDMKYCIKVAAFTKKGTGPYTTPKCVEMTGNSLLKLQTSSPVNSIFSEKETNSSLKSFVNEPWFISLIVLTSVIIISLMFYCVWFMFKRVSIKQKKCKYMSTSSENGSLNVPHKIDNGNRYKLVNDTIWLDTLHSNSNQSNQECCCVPDLHHQIFVQQNPGNGNNIHLIHDLNCQAAEKHQQRLQNHSIKSKFAPINKINNNLADSNNLLSNTTTTTTTTSSSGGAPQYAEIYGPTMQQLQQQLQSTNPYATTGLFVHGNNNLDDTDPNLNSNNSSSNPYNIINYQTVNNASNFRNIPNIIDSNGNIKYSSYTIKLLADKMLANQTEAELNNNQSTLLADQKKLLKYLQATQSQSNTPRVQVKNLQNRVKSVDNQQHHSTNCCYNSNSNNNHMHNHTLGQGTLQMGTSIPIGTLPINQHQLISYLSEGNNDPITNEAIRNFLDLLPTANNASNNNQQHNSNQPSLPLAPPPSLASALIAQQQKQQQLLEGFNNFVASTMSRTPQSPVHYNSPWNVNLEGVQVSNNNNQNAFLVNRIMNNQTAANSNSNSSSIISNLTGNSTLSRGLNRNSPHRNSNNNSSTFTAQQYANRTLNAKQQQLQLQLQLQHQQMQQDYSSISPEEDLNVNDFKFSEYQKQQQQQQQQQRSHTHGMVQSWGSVADTASSNPISSSYDSANNQNSLSTSSNSSDLSSKRSSRSEDDLNLSKQINSNDDEKNKFLPIIQTVIDTSKCSNKTNAKHYLISNDHENDDIYLSEMPQTIL